MADQARVSYPGISDIKGCSVSNPRGVAPGVTRILARYTDGDSVEQGSLTLTFGTTSIRFDGCVPDMRTLRLEKRQYNEGIRRRGRFERTILVWDRRKQWESLSSTANINQRWRDCTVRTGSKMEPEDVVTELLGIAGETNISADGLPTGVYPEIRWDTRPFLDALRWLCDQYAVDICYEKEDKFSVAPLGSGTVPPPGPFNINPVHDFSAERGPKNIRIITSPTLYQDALHLYPVGLDVDGTWKYIYDLSYMPPAGWAGEWPTLFSNVAQQHRHLALKTVWRCFQVRNIQSLPSYQGSVTTRKQIELGDTLVEMGGTDDDKYEIPAYCFGQFWPLSDHPVNTKFGYRHHGPFTIDKTNRIVWFDYPVVKLGTVNCIEEPDMYLVTGFRIRINETGNDKLLYVRKTFDVERESGEGWLDLEHPELWNTRIQRYDDNGQATGGVVDNVSEIQAEADVYLGAHKDKWDNGTEKKDVSYAGIRDDITCTGKIQHVTYRTGHGVGSQTRCSQGCNHIPG